MRRFLSLAMGSLLGLAGGSYGLAQEPPEAPAIRELPLEPPSDTMRLPVNVNGFVGLESHCDSDGGVYVRPDGPTHPLQIPIMRLSKDKQPVTFDIGPAPKGAENYLHAFAVDARGELVAIARTVSKDSVVTNLVTFRSDGTILRKAAFQADAIVLRMVALPEDELLLSGFEVVRGQKGKTKAFVRIYGRDGRLKRSLYEDDKGSQGGDDPAFQFSSAQVGPDGSIYVLRSTKPPTLEIFTPDGTRVNTYKLAPPIKDGQSVQLHIVYPRALVPYQRSATPEKGQEPEIRMDFGVYDLTTGELLMNLVQRKPGIMFCVVRNEMIYLIAAKDGFLSLGKRPLP